MATTAGRRRPDRGATTRQFSRPTPARVVSTAGYVAGWALLASAAALLASAGVAVLDGRRALVPLAALGTASLAAGALLWRRCTTPRTLRTSAVHGAVLSGWLLLVAISTATYLATGTIDRVDHALVESTAGFTTTAVSVIDDLERVPKGVLLWRATTQWLGGFAAALVVTAVLPLFASTSGRAGNSAAGGGRRPLRSPRVAAALRRLALGYLVLSAAGVALFLVAGMGPFDALTYAMTTISTGGFGNHRGSIGFFGSALVEWATIGGMVLGGTSLVLVLAAVRGRLTPLRGSTELHAYAATLVVGSVLMVWWTAPTDGITHQSVRHAVFAVTSAASTTGHTVGRWGGWASGPQVLLLVLAAVGAMSGAAGGGFRAVRALTLLGVVRREVVRQLHPRSVVAVKVGGRPVDEAVISHTVGYQVAWVLLAAVGAVGLALGGFGVAAAMSGAVSALATFGPALGDLAPSARGAMDDLPTGALLALLPLMLAGRLEISPLAVGAASLLRRVGRERRRAERRDPW